VLRDINGNILATETLSETRVTNDLVFHFTDGSLHQEVTVFSQLRRFQLPKDYLVQKGKAFKRSTDMRVDAWNGKVKVILVDNKGKEKVFEEQLTLPTDLANGMVGTLLGDIATGRRATTLSMLVATPKPRVVKPVIRPEDECFASHPLRDENCHRWVARAVAPVAGNQPPEPSAAFAGNVRIT
jgi:hypothetical protein